MSSADQDLYDEFGNYIGPELNSSSDDDDSSSSEEEEEEEESLANNEDFNISEMQIETLNSQEFQQPVDPSSAIVLHEDKVHYPSASTIYGNQVTTAILDEDTMDISEPIMPPEPQNIQAVDSKGGLEFTVEDSYLTQLAFNPHLTRGISLIGHLHSGKTSLLDVLLKANLQSNVNVNVNVEVQKYTDTTKLEQEKLMSLKSTPMTLAMNSSYKSKSYAFTLLDNPGHIQFHDESVSTMALSDGVLLVLDVVEGITLHDELLLKQVIQYGLPLTVCLNKMDRLIVDLKLSLEDSYYKIRHLLEELNLFVKVHGNGKYPKLDLRKNVILSSAQHGWILTLEGMAGMYLDHVESIMEDDENSDDNDENGFLYDYSNQKHVLGKNLSLEEFTARLWGDCFLDPTSMTFKKKMSDCIPTEDTQKVQRTFSTFVLGPIYKLYAACLGESEKDVSKVLRSVGIHLSKDVLRASSSVLIQHVMEKFMQGSSGFVDLMIKNIPTPTAAAVGKVSRHYTGALNTSIARSMLKTNPNGPLMIHVTKLYPKHDAQSTTSGHSYSALGRIYSGTVKAGDKVKVMGEGYSPEDDEDMAFATVEKVSLPRGRYETEVSMGKAGSWVLLDGVDANILKTATITSAKNDFDTERDIEIFKPLRFTQAGGEAVMKLSVEPLNPSDLPKMVEGLRRVSKSYPMVRTRVEESGEHVLFGTGELYLDCVMHDLRHVYSDIEIKAADPVVGFRETVVETSNIKCFAETANKRNKLTMISEPLDEGLAEQLEAGKVNIDWDPKKIGRFFQQKYDWDLLSARSVWAFGDSASRGPNILMDDTLPSEVDKSLLNACKSGIIQGFQWAMREGPLCEEPVRSTKLKILDTVLADKPIYRGAGQIIPTARRVVHSSLLAAAPRLMEPVYRLEIQCQGDIVDAINPLLNKRRGHIVQDRPIAGSPFFRVKAFLPVMDSFGFETDLRTFTQGQAMVHSVFDHWAVVPGDPLDKNVILHPLEPSPPHCLARDFLIKTRRRKGLSEDVSLVKFFDEGMMA